MGQGLFVAHVTSSPPSAIVRAARASVTKARCRLPQVACTGQVPLAQPACGLPLQSGPKKNAFFNKLKIEFTPKKKILAERDFSEQTQNLILHSLMQHQRLKIAFFFGFFFLPSQWLWAQNFSSGLRVNGYAETYYLFDFNRPENQTLPDFIFSHNRHNEVNLNLGFARLEYETSNVRGSLALAAGSYVNANYSQEPQTLANIFEGKVGFRVSSSKPIWLDMGVFESHIGFESAIGSECWNLSRSLLAEHSPYYQAGIKITYGDAKSRWLLSGLLLNGWQRLARQPGNNTPAFGHQLKFQPNARWTFNSSSFFGNDKPDSASAWRAFHNFYTQFEHAKWGFILGFDIGFEQSETQSASWLTWYSPVAILRRQIRSNMWVAARVEQFADRQQVLISTHDFTGFDVWGWSVNLDVHISDAAIWRIEFRRLESRNSPIFPISANGFSPRQMIAATSLALRF
jgi:hypothetical protein